MQALGYAASLDWDAHKEERIQLHADKLYHQMLDYEQRAAEARAAGREPPPITSLFRPDAQPVASHTLPNARSPSDSDNIVIPGGETFPEGYTPHTSLKDLTPHERELAVRSVNAEIEQNKAYADEARPFVQKQQEARAKRQEKAKGWFGETIGKWIT